MMRRLYVGGLSHTITQKDLRERFGKFGEVDDVELRTRRDDQGVPYKTFGYVNITITDAEFKRCTSVLNKAKWKGGTLQIEAAKESFLDKLAEERQALSEQRQQQQQQPSDPKQQVLESLKKAGVENFHMKAAVPGTEVPGHEGSWVVSKFGRVLPVVELTVRRGNRSKTVSYDPSKHSHNIKRLETPDETPTPISMLTWELTGGDDDISKKRRGEFPPSIPWRPKRRRTVPEEDTPVDSTHSAVDDAARRPGVPTDPRSKAPDIPSTPLHNGDGRAGPRRPKAVCVLNDNAADDDSDEEIRRLVKNQRSSQGALGQEVEDDDRLEVVGEDFLDNSGRSRQQHKGVLADKDEDDYDSADTDELLTSKRPPAPHSARGSGGKAGNTEELQGERLKSLSQEERASGTDSPSSESERDEEEEEEEEDDDDDDDQDADSSSDIDTSQGENVQKTSAAAADGGETDDDDDDSSDDDDDDSDEGDSEYEALFSNCPRLEISLADLQRLASDSQTTLPTVPCTTQTGSPPTPSASSTTQALAADVRSRSTETPLPSIPCANTKPPRAPKKGITPDEILAAIMENVGSSDDDGQNEVRKKVTCLPAFQGTKKLMEKIEKDTKGERMNEPRRTGLNTTELQNAAVTLSTETFSKPKDTQTSSEPQDTETDETSSETDETSSETNEMSSETEEMETSSKLRETKMPSKPQTAQSLKPQETQTSSKTKQKQISSNPQEMETESSGTQHVTNTLSSPNQQSVTRVNHETSSDDSSSSEEEDISVRVAEEPDEEKQRQSNLRRLAAMEHRVQLVEQHKKIIQGALGNVDTPAAGSGKHTVFGSDDDDDEVKQTSVKKNLLVDSQINDKDSGDDEAIQKPSGSKLFDNSDDEDGDDEDSRFQIKPQFEGRAGQKLMALQSRFGTDQRFQMDSRFLESDEEEGEEGPGSQKEGEKGDLAEEKTKNLTILQSVLNINLDTHTTTHTPSKAKTFRDVLHYDPSRQEHVAFETKTEEQPKESKASRKKKREEASQLPEVSTEIYYDVSADLKAAFGLTDHKTDEKSHDRGEGIESLGWDKMEEEEEEEEKEEEQSGEGPRTETDALMSTYMTSDLAAGQQDEGLGFKFSFFSDDAQLESKQETEYSVEALHGPKVSWQTDPRFQDSSSDEEEEQRDEEEEEESRETTIEPQTPVKKDFFFFCADDYRLTEGPRLFCRSSELGEQQEAWEEKRNSLIQDYRKKHREARKKVNFSHRS